MITLEAYWKGRDKEYADELTDQIRANAQVTVDRVNELLAHAGRSSIDSVNSGWRPAAVNDATSNAAASSRHLTAEAADLPDPDRSLARWSADHTRELAEVGIWMEHPGWTWSEWGNHWVHWQIVPPKSGNRIYIPSKAQPKDPTFRLTGG